MPTKPVQRFTSWSYSRLTDWEGCGYRAKLKHLDKLKEPGSPAMTRGLTIHAEAESYATGQTKERPVSLENFKDEFAGLRKQRRRLLVEQDWAVTKAWLPTTWFDSDAKPGELPWLRCRVDTAVPFPAQKQVSVIDYKTGKVRDSHLEQLSLYAAVALALMPAMRTVSTALWYLDQGEIKTRTFTRADEKQLRKTWVQRSAPMLADTAFAPKPSELCRWCHYRKSNGGPCRY